ncbi:MAG: hypothetical protein SWX82_34810 [Cyanobacteriota bacterium]|nr:hypothetical protein [Cyanobacteriota bacterium]
MKHLEKKVTIGKIFHTINSHVEAIAILTNQSNYHCVKLKKKRQGISSCILKKIIIVCNYWVELAPTHDFLFNAKTAFCH